MTEQDKPVKPQDTEANAAAEENSADSVMGDDDIAALLEETQGVSQQQDTAQHAAEHAPRPRPAPADATTDSVMGDDDIAALLEETQGMPQQRDEDETSQHAAEQTPTQTDTNTDSIMGDDDIAALLDEAQSLPSNDAVEQSSEQQEQNDEQAAIDALLAGVDQSSEPEKAIDSPVVEDIAWPLPEFEDTTRDTAEPVSNVLNMKPAWFNEEPVEEEPEIQFEPMTIEELEALRQSAYEEGFAEGKDAGHNEGLVSGQEEGLALGKTQGQQEGLSQGLTEGQQQIDALGAQWGSLIDQLHQPNRQIDAEVEQQVVDLAMKLAAEIVQVELVSNPNIIAKTVKQAVAALPLQKQHIRIHLHPVDLAIIEQIFPPETQEKKKWQLLADGSLTQGDCLIENDLSSVSVEMNEVIKQSLQSFIRQNGQDDDAEPTT
ncbi:flagellar assembly protein FliH [Agarivorans sp. 1_MG-2023]|uniref:flagellar assembly protein FliH n=1 Tax=Agarivorans sp. 1_MG-2023 TaxID=3062634 RepID=UPI0026E155C0|nr:flagellar assembly protein FliH [Agarivorans sp. 1_MG-2023]MDO6764742.1 flagellar assembly protein FliH [Agarivorans sp. 1_MG-2023]